MARTIEDTDDDEDMALAQEEAVAEEEEMDDRMQEDAGGGQVTNEMGESDSDEEDKARISKAKDVRRREQGHEVKLAIKEDGDGIKVVIEAVQEMPPLQPLPQEEQQDPDESESGTQQEGLMDADTESADEEDAQEEIEVEEYEGEEEEKVEEVHKKQKVGPNSSEKPPPAVPVLSSADWKRKRSKGETATPGGLGLRSSQKPKAGLPEEPKIGSSRTKKPKIEAVKKVVAATSGDKGLDKKLNGVLATRNLANETPLHKCYGAGMHLGFKWQLYMGVTDIMGGRSCVHGDTISLLGQNERWIVVHPCHDVKLGHFAVWAWCTKPPKRGCKRLRKFEYAAIRWDLKDGSRCTAQQWQQMTTQWEKEKGDFHTRIMTQSGRSALLEEDEEEEDEPIDLSFLTRTTPKPSSKRTGSGKGKQACDIEQQIESPKTAMMREQCDALQAMRAEIDQLRSERSDVKLEDPVKGSNNNPSPPMQQPPMQQPPAMQQAPMQHPMQQPHMQQPSPEPYQAPTYQPAHPFQGM